MRTSYMALETSRRGKTGLWGPLKGIIFPASGTSIVLRGTGIVLGDASCYITHMLGTYHTWLMLHSSRTVYPRTPHLMQ